MRILLLILAAGLLTCVGQTQPIYPYDPNNAPFQCEGTDEDDPLRSLDEISGTVKILWIVAAADSGALPQSWPMHPGGQDTGNTRVMNPSTYRMPSWTSRLFNPDYPWSLSRYYLEQSGGRFIVEGQVVGRDSLRIFTCDPDTAVRPRKMSMTGGPQFFLNIMPKVDSVVNFADYTYSPTDTVAWYIVFNIYGHAEDCQSEGGGISRLPYSYTTQDTNAIGQRIKIKNYSGVTSWSAAEQTLSIHDDCPWVGAEDSVRLAYYGALGIGAHEFTHKLGFGHTFSDSGNGSEYGMYREAHLGCGSFDVVGGEIGWPDPDVDGAGGPPAPLNPISRIFAGWITPVTVNTPLLDYTLNDHLWFDDDVCLKIDAARPDAADQYFAAVAVTRNTPWDRLWPANGVMIEHANPSGNQTHRSHKRFDCELSSGLYVWHDSLRISNPGWNCRTAQGDTCRLWTGENTLVANTETGLDSFDYVWAANPQVEWPTKMYYGLYDGQPHPTGTVGNYFVPGQSFNDLTNPSAAAQRNTTPFAQNLPTMAGLDVLAVNQWNHTCTVNAWSRHWSGTISTSATWLDSIVVDGNVTFAAGDTLTIQPGTKIRVLPNAEIRFNGQIHAVGTAQNPIVFDCATPNQMWEGLTIQNSNSQNKLEHVIVRHAQHGVKVVSGYAALNHVTTENCGTGVFYLASTGILDSSLIRNSYSYGVQIFGGTVTVRRDTISGSGNSGLHFVACDYANVWENVICDNGSYHGIEYPYLLSGIDASASALTLRCNVIHNNGGSGLTLFPSTYAQVRRSVVENNMVLVDSFGYDFGQIYLAGGTLDINCGLNTIRVDGDVDTLIRSQHTDLPAPGWGAVWNYWGESDPTGRICNSPSLDPQLGEPWDCHDLEFPSCAVDSETALFEQGWQQERATQYAAALATYEIYLSAYPEGVYEKLVLERIEFCQAAQGWEWKDIEDYFRTLAADSSSDAALVTLCRGNAAWCMFRNGETDDAYDSLVVLLDEATNEYETVTLALKLYMVELELEYAQITTTSTANTLSAKITRLETRVDSLLSTLGHSVNAKPAATIPVPTKYALYQNYPNPFNPITEIRFDLPEKAKVELKIFNTLGQLVTTLVSEARPAGAYTVRWDGSNVATGMYIYQLQAGSFTDTKKMLFMK